MKKVDLLISRRARLGFPCSVAAIACVGLGAALPVQAAAGDAGSRATVTVQAGGAGKKISTDLFGIFFEDINYSADGGLYAELVQNRSFEYSARDNGAWNSLTAWKLSERGGGRGTVAVEARQSVHANNPQYAVLTVEAAGSGAGAGVGLENAGFDGIPLQAGEKYNFSCFARFATVQSEKQPTPLEVRLEGPDGTLYARASLGALTRDWRKHTATLTSTGSVDNAKLVILATGPGAVALDMASLFPQKTFRGRANGLRADLAQTIADLKPQFVRFPGGCLAHGDGINNIYDWKKTIGPIERRKGQRNIWNYHQSAGLGYYEYFQFCEDIGAKALPVVAAGVSCQNSFQQWGVGQQCIPLENMDEYIQDVLDLVEWANGPATSTWGAKRAAAGHPKPFNLQYLGVGNEDKITPEFEQRFAMIYKAVKAKYPKLTVIGTVGPAPRGEDFDAGWKIAKDMKLEMVDEHYYESPQWFLANNTRYDSYKRTQAKVYLGEYASRGNTLFNALSEAAYMAGLERNGDVVHLASYAPLLARVGHTQWNPDLIYFDGTRVAPTVNYYVQQLYGVNAGDTSLPTTVAQTSPASVAAAVAPAGVFVGTWNTQAQFDDARLESGGAAPVLSEPFEAAGQWNGESGTWQAEGGVYSQSGSEQPALSRAVGVAAAPIGGQADYTFSVRARKTGGSEGFLIGFGATGASDYYWWNLGGWNNTQHGIQKHHAGASEIVGAQVAGSIETGRWYSIKVVVKGPRIQCYLDGRLVHDVVDDSKYLQNLVVSSVRDSRSGDIILKIVNPAPTAVQSQINLAGLGAVQPVATQTVLAGDPGALNTFASPRTVVPQSSSLAVGKSFAYTAAPSSFSVIRLRTRGR